MLFPCKGHDILRATLSALYGYGNVRHNYDLPVFQVISEEDIAKYMELAVEIWERNIHREWMKKCGYETHNGTKDELFLQQMIADKSKAIETHRRRSHNREKGDTPHHIFSEPNIIRRIIEAQGDHELNKYLLESVYDKVTATTRYWYKLKKEQLQSCFEERLISNMNEGYYVNPEFRWKKGVFGFTNDYETRLWQLWLDVHYEFKEYWTKKFGQNEELWQPPAPLEVLKAKANI